MNKQQREFRQKITNILSHFDKEVLSYNTDEFWLIQQAYEYLEFFAESNMLSNTAIALPLARGLHDGVHRKAFLRRNGINNHYPYVIHCLSVCRMLADLLKDLPHDELDILLASSLCHDMIEDIDFPKHGTELYEDYYLDKKVYETVKLVSKRKDFTEQEEKEFFDNIAHNRLALLVKLSDRGHNVEDLFNMSCTAKIHEYIKETKTLIKPMADYGIVHYPDIADAIEVLLDKIVLLTDMSQALVDNYEISQRKLEEQVKQLKEENAALKSRFNKIWEGETL